METTNEQTEEIISQVAEAKGNNGENNETASFGKFKDADALKKAYNSLESEFTKRCQRIKELECELADKSKLPEGKDESGSESKEETLKEYLKELLDAKSKAIIIDGMGSGAKTPTAKPKTVREAGNLARDFLTK